MRCHGRCACCLTISATRPPVEERKRFGNEAHGTTPTRFRILRKLVVHFCHSLAKECHSELRLAVVTEPGRRQAHKMALFNRALRDHGRCARPIAGQPMISPVHLFTLQPGPAQGSRIEKTPTGSKGLDLNPPTTGRSPLTTPHLKLSETPPCATKAPADRPDPTRETP